MNNGDIYRETILDHYRNPRNKGRLSNHDVSVQDSNPLCGDEIEIHLKVEANMIKDIKFEGRGCAISQASASQLTEMVINKPLIFAMDLSKHDIFENMGLTNLGPARVFQIAYPKEIVVELATLDLVSAQLRSIGRSAH